MMRTQTKRWVAGGCVGYVVALTVLAHFGGSAGLVVAEVYGRALAGGLIFACVFAGYSLLIVGYFFQGEPSRTSTKWTLGFALPTTAAMFGDLYGGTLGSKVWTIVGSALGVMAVAGCAVMFCIFLYLVTQEK